MTRRIHRILDKCGDIVSIIISSLLILQRLKYAKTLGESRKRIVDVTLAQEATDF